MPIIRRLLPAAAALLALAAASPALATGDPPPHHHPGTSPYRAVVLAHRPAAYWRLGEQPSALVAADETQQHPGAYVGPPTLGIAGEIWRDADTAIDLDGLQTQPLGQFVHVAEDDGLAFPGRAPFTLEAWVQPGGRNDVTRRIFSSEGRDGGYLLGMRNGELAFSRYAGGQWSTLSTGVDPTRWSHVAATYDGTVMRIYVEGWLAAQGPSWLELADERADLSIGAKQSRWRFYAGGLDEVAIYPYALSYGQVHSHARVGGGVR
ncbi:MAG TPA: LamG domain-containing protein [Conexibacter sp.]|nr:LamG domain-containing protein [Conexibacter sp.]